MSRALMLFTGDLRLHDQPALTSAIRDCEEIVPAFVLDENLLGGSCGSPNRLAFLLDCLRDLDAGLRSRGAGLVLRQGDVVEQAMKLAARWKTDALYLTAATTPYGTRRQERLAAECRRSRIALHCLPGANVVRPGELRPTGGDHYRVFTPYWRVWSARPPIPCLPAPRRIETPGEIPLLRLPALAKLAAATPSPKLIPGGEKAARARLRSWTLGGLADYEQRHDDLAGEATSRLSADLHFGCLSPGAVAERVAGRPGGEPYLRQLCWRDFYSQVLAARPDLPRSDYRPRGDRWRRSARDGEAWRAGLTGYPIVDAGMRQLTGEGFMHNRTRMIVGSFLTKLLYLDWRIGAAHFAELLQDADVANNVGNWQWVAGTGNDTRPNRVLNPLRQAQRFDPQGTYVRRHVPELASLPGALIHEPWRLPRGQRSALGYPAPIVDHASAAEELRRRRAAAPRR